MLELDAIASKNGMCDGYLFPNLCTFSHADYTFQHTKGTYSYLGPPPSAPLTGIFSQIELRWKTAPPVRQLKYTEVFQSSHILLSALLPKMALREAPSTFVFLYFMFFKIQTGSGAL